MHSSVPRPRLFLGAVPITPRYYLQEYITLQKLFQLLPLLFTRIYNATEAVPITSRYDLQEYITLQKCYKN